MTVKALFEYRGEVLDSEDRFHGNQLVYICWDKHLMFCAPFALPLPPETPFAALLEQVLPGLYDSHPQWPQVDWDQVEWKLDDKPFVPTKDQGLRAQGVGHKSVIRFYAPGLDGIAGTAS